MTKAALSALPTTFSRKDSVMTLRKALLITYHFPPQAASGSFRLLGFARHLPRAGWQPIVVAPPELPWEPSDEELAAQIPADVLLQPVPYPVGAPRLLRRLAPVGMWLPRAWSACRAVMREHRPEAVLTSGPPHWVHLLGLSLRRSFGVPWVADFRDPWVNSDPDKRRSWSARWALYWERKVLSAADCVVANAPNATRLFQDMYPAHADKILTLTNGFDPADTPSESPALEPLRLVHAGELYYGRNPLPLLDALAAWNCQDGPPGRRARLEVIGRNYLSVDMAEEIRRRGLEEDVAMTGQLPYREALQEMARAGILVLFDTPGRHVGVPAKLYEYFGAGRPILALAEPAGDVAHVLRDSGTLYRLASPHDAGQIRQALTELVQEMMERPDDGADARRLRRYTREHLTGELALLLDRLARPAASAAQVISARVMVGAADAPGVPAPGPGVRG
jgi:glycosyltransferase involved in cell wall biosynthesis